MVMSGTSQWSIVSIQSASLIPLTPKSNDLTPIMISHIHFRFFWQMRTPTFCLSAAFVSGWCQYHTDQYIAEIRFSVWFMGKMGKQMLPVQISPPEQATRDATCLANLCAISISSCWQADPLQQVCRCYTCVPFTKTAWLMSRQSIHFGRLFISLFIQTATFSHPQQTM